MNNEVEYLVSYGTCGDFSRFRPMTPRAYERGDRVVIRGAQGLELGEVLCQATEDHSRFLSRTALGELLRLASEDDERAAERAHRRALAIAEDARRLADEMGLPLEVLDVELFLDGSQATVNHLRQVECDYRPLVSTLSRKYDVLIVMQNLALPVELEAAGKGCGKPGCGQAEGGGCGSCGSGGCGTGGCATGCGSGAKKDDVAAYLTGLREQMERRGRTSLL